MTVKKGRKFTTVTNEKFGVSVEVYVDKELTFWADYGDYHIHSKVAEDVVNQVQKAIEQANALTWIPIILVRYTRPKGNKYNPHPLGDRFEKDQAEFEVSIERHYIAQKADGRWSKVDWYTPDDCRISSARFWAYGEPVNHRDGAFKQAESVIHYTDAVWMGLYQIMEYTRSLSDRVYNLIRSEDAAAMLEQAGNAAMIALPAPKPDAPIAFGLSTSRKTAIKQASFRLDQAFAAELALLHPDLVVSGDDDQS